MAVDCTPQGLATAAQQFECCVPDGLHRPLQTYLLAQIALSLGAISSADPSAIAKAASCFECAWGNNAAMDTFLLCAIANAVGA